MNRLPCLRDSGLTAVLTPEKLDEQLADMVDAVIDYWMLSFGNDCNNRYFCPACEECIMVRSVKTRKVDPKKLS